ncbi:uncharacterized protein LOC130907867 [Corythoichthys intestinalis]|uniref:uncharacterized protein LOC130907867 n=1 Tax=Corythoichthys intestinalis TaxID=161448 RepID=UPI0025A62104|nr:uncharacterized protein LOC130907867 [Corythoichthys intestinalis]
MSKAAMPMAADPPQPEKLDTSENLSAAGLAEESEKVGGVPIHHRYRRDLLNEDGVELCFEEVRAKEFLDKRKKQLHEECLRLCEEKMQLELQVAHRSSLMRQSARYDATRSVSEEPSSLPPYSGMSEADLGANKTARLPDTAGLSQRSNGGPDQTRDQVFTSVAEVVPETRSKGDGTNPHRRDVMSCDLPSGVEFEEPLPDVQEDYVVCLGGKRYQTSRRLLAESGVLAYEGSRGQCSVIIKVDRCQVSRDFDAFGRLTDTWPAGADSPRVQRFQFRDGCVTVYETPPSHIFSEFSERLLSEDSLPALAPSLLRLMEAMRACGAEPADLRPDSLISCHTMGAGSDWLFPLEWRAAATDAREDQADSPDVAQRLHLLLTEYKTAAVERRTADSSGPRALTGGPWGDAFRSLLNVDSWTCEQWETFAALCG